MKELVIAIELGSDVPDEDAGLERARRAALESAVLELWEAGHLSTRQAARRLGRTYHEYLDLLAERGIPVSSGVADAETLEQVHQQLRREGRGP